MNPTTLFSFGLPALVAWSLLDDFEKARIKRGLAPTVEVDQPEAIVFQHDRPDSVSECVPEWNTLPATATPTPQPPKPKTFEERKARLIEVLGEHNLTPIWELRNATPIRFTGWQRSGKSTKAQALALLRQIDNPSHPVTVCTPHHPTPGDRQWSDSFTTTGEGNQWGQIRVTIDRLMARLAKGDTAPYTTILDEFSGYAGNGGMDEKYIQSLMMSAIREMSKHHEFLVLIAHGDTAALNGNIKGLTAAMWGNFVTVQCHRKLVDGKGQPSPIVDISGGGFPATRLNWPDWFTPEWLLENFPELQTIVPKTIVNATPSLLEPEPITEPEVNGMEPHLKAIVEYITRKAEPVTPRQIQTAKLKALVDCNINKIEAIQLCLDTLVYEGILQNCGIDTYSLVGSVGVVEQRVDYPHALLSHIHNLNPHPENL